MRLKNTSNIENGVFVVALASKGVKMCSHKTAFTAMLCVYTKTIILFNLGEQWQNIYLAATRLSKYSTTIHLDFKE